MMNPEDVTHSDNMSSELEAYITPDGSFTPEHVGQLFFDSFRFSQGNTQIQAEIFRFLKQNYGQHLNADLIKQGVERVEPRIMNFATKGLAHSTRASIAVAQGITEEETEWLDILAEPDNAEPVDTFKLLKDVFVREEYILRNGGRPDRPDELSETSRSSSKHMSHFVFYGLLGKDTGSPEYNALFSKFVDDFEEVPDLITMDDPTLPQPTTPLLPIFETHFQNYPGDVQQLTARGLAALQDRFEPAELQRIGVPIAGAPS